VLVPHEGAGSRRGRRGRSAGVPAKGGRQSSANARHGEEGSKDGVPPGRGLGNTSRVGRLRPGRIISGQFEMPI
jgi:hypothetical protein